jgi:hypothetical protein
MAGRFCLAVHFGQFGVAVLVRVAEPVKIMRAAAI